MNPRGCMQILVSLIVVGLFLAVTLYFVLNPIYVIYQKERHMTPPTIQYTYRLTLKHDEIDP